MSEYLKQQKNDYTQPKSNSKNPDQIRAAQLKALEFQLQKRTLQKFAKDEGDEKQLKLQEEDLQMKSGSGGEGSRTKIPEDVKLKMENSFGTDFSDVNIHKDSKQATNIGALAYTQGNDVHFAPGQYEPGSQKGQELLAHELTHVLQQREGRVKPDTEQPAFAKATAGNINSDTTLEKEADEMGSKAAQGKMADVRGSENGVQKKGDEKEKWTITRYVSPAHKGGYQHIFDEKERLIILTPVHGPHTFHITTTPENYVDKGDGASVGVGTIQQVNIHDVFHSLYMFYHSRPELEHPFVNHIYRHNKEDGYDYVQYRSIRGVNQAHKDFFNKGGWMMFALVAVPFAIEAIPFIIQASPHLITKIPKPLLIKALKKVGKSFLIKSGENIIDGLISYIFTGDFDLVSMGLNYAPGMSKSKKIKLLFKGLLLIADAGVDYNFNEHELKVITKNKPVDEAAIDLVFITFGKITNDAVNKEFSSNFAKLLLRGQSNTLFTGTSNALKSGINENE